LQAGRTALHFAAIGGSAEAVHLLCRHGAVVNARGNLGTTPLSYAAVHGHCEAAKALMQWGGASILFPSVSFFLCTTVQMSAKTISRQ
jgi:ankyrin repeat protein